MTESRHDDFLRGILAALSVVDYRSHDSLFDEIVRDFGHSDLARVARKDGMMRESGMDRYSRGVKRGVRR